MTNDQIKVIERLRCAANEHGEVSDLLDTLEESIYIDELGGLAIAATDAQVDYLKSALMAAKFARYDRLQDGGE